MQVVPKQITALYCWENPTGDVLIIAQRMVSTLTQYFTWFDKSSTSTREVNFIRDRERIQ
jgi:hypothetical protein